MVEKQTPPADQERKSVVQQAAIPVALLTAAVGFALFRSRAEVDGVRAGDGMCEGYWPPPEVCLPLGAERRQFAPGDAAETRGCPQRRVAVAPWPEKASFLTKLQAIEAAAKEFAAAMPAATADMLAECGMDKKAAVDIARPYPAS
eukprot:gnl/TRDRNA2_/TRDRNA2_165898_c1_seq4.p2 gnl/TRDRNA2_/TRDRNA2_165898_c1~~gnl/TRDRNA2_/TRDRNA2_165898_c1_seq4.p2  ORF type:complete len:146 (+),score=34.77 gnl/TRDRNA2_/TRDRNA2_165898_c1_seq4:120-557(+)